MPAKELAEKKQKLCKRYDIAEDSHFLTFSCFHNQPFLKRDRCCQWLADSIIKAQEEKLFDLWAYVFMPNHVHLILWPHEGVGISRILSKIKLPVNRRAVAWIQKNAPFF
jgi:putative transposase